MTEPVGLTAAEHQAMRLTVALVEVVVQSVIGRGPSRNADVAEFVHHVHAIQHTVMAQAAARAHPDLYRLLGEVVQP